MKSKRGIIFASIIIAILVIVMVLLVNHIICQNDKAPAALKKIDNKSVEIYNSAADSITSSLNYVIYIYQKITAIDAPEYPNDNLPLYHESRVIDYKFDDESNSLWISSGSNDSFETITADYQAMFTDELTVDYFKQYSSTQSYTAYGMVGNFTFLMEIMPSEHRKYDYEINTSLSYLKGNDLDMENFFRQNVGSNSYLYSNPYIHMYMMPNDNENIYLQLRDYKSQLLNIDTHVKLYIDGELHSTRYYGDTIVLPVSALNQLHIVRMIAFDENDCIWAIDEMQNTLLYNASAQTDFYELASYFSSAQNLFVYNTDSIEDIGYLQYFTNLESLYLRGNDKITDYNTILNMPVLSELYLDNVNNRIVKNLNQIKSLNVLELSNISLDIDLGADFANLQCSELIIDNCSNVTFDEYGLFSMSLERLEIDYNYSLKNIGFISVYPQLHILDISNCDRLTTVLNTVNLPNLNMVSIDNCAAFDLSQPLDNMNSLMYVSFANNIALAKHSDIYINSIWSNTQLISFSVQSCNNVDDFSYNYEVWKAGQ